MINARPHPNGNTIEHFSEAYKSLTEAEMAIKNAIIDCTTNIFHGRNYQHIPVSGEMQREDDMSLAGLRRALTDIAMLKIDIANAVRGK